MADSQTLGTPEARRRFRELHKQYSQMMLNTAAGILKDRHLAEDAVQETFMRIMRNFHKIGEIDHPSTRAFVMVIVRNVSLNMLTRTDGGMWSEQTDTELAAEGSIEDTILDRIDYEQVVSVIQALPPIYRDTLLMYYLEELKTPEIALRLGIETETVKKRLQRGKQMVLDICGTQHSE